jgi:hypothetical protein
VIGQIHIGIRAPQPLIVMPHPSYRSGGSKETEFGNVPLIIVNGLVTITSGYPFPFGRRGIVLPTIRPVWGRQAAALYCGPFGKDAIAKAAGQASG